jgi:hypothetical protein
MTTFALFLIVLVSGLYDDSFLLFDLVGYWQIDENPNHYDGSSHVTNVAGDLWQMAFVGDAVAIYGLASPDGGTAEICINDECINVDWRYPVPRYQHQIVSVNGLGSGTHNLKITAVGDGNISIDAIYISPSILPDDPLTETFDDGAVIQRVDAGQLMLIQINVVGTVLLGLVVILLAVKS